MSRALKIVFAGTPQFAVPALDALLGSPHRVLAVYTQPDRPAGRGRKPTASPVKHRALREGLEVRQPSTLRAEAEQRHMAGLAPDVMVVVAYGVVLPPEVLAIPARGCLNIHASLLPRWRGAAPIQRALLAGDAETGITIMQMDAGLDTGDMLVQVRCPIGPDDTAQSLHDRLAVLGAGALLDTLAAIEQGAARPVAQYGVRATYAGKIAKAEAVIDWGRPAEEVERRVRAFNPWPVAQTELDGRTLRVWLARALAEEHASAPGTVLRADRTGIYVACGRGVLRLDRVQVPGKRSMGAADFVNAYDVAGAVLASGHGRTDAGAS
ncbi:MAG: methionyl-tRNA formyltransferase [Gammaproteobacteria bacterium]|nr:methionyl-tRNA formyltransferase [Gammaproteobacteria bacterium]NIR98383.1 methionyl-tRNA formyltransferase [Gammaproteobacteria bacterium]NIT64137.1 methionyl-tRNA formyltransferase [Gammaproteobacteria bacterium]NIV21074.1 methionyl-tRNA formyltransferase [Gammaproteobacteria bacterium]NIY32717.1 methionyl-tRNA formyltransferase [Gammaproteobacteria bacterium]